MMLILGSVSDKAGVPAAMRTSPGSQGFTAALQPARPGMESACLVGEFYIFCGEVNRINQGKLKN